MLSSATLRKVEYDFNIPCIKRWSLLPVPSHKIVHFPISGAATMYHTLRFALSKGFPIPQNCYDKNAHGELVKQTDFIHYIYSDETERQVIWETIFNLDHVQKKRKRCGSGVNNRTAITCDIEFFNGAKTDGHMISTLFKKKGKIGTCINSSTVYGKFSTMFFWFK